MGVPPVRPLIPILLSFLVSSLMAVLVIFGYRSMFVAIILVALYVILCSIYFMLVMRRERG